MHATNNALVILLVRAGVEDPPPILSLTGAGLAVASSLALLLGFRLLRGPKPALPET